MILFIRSIPKMFSNCFKDLNRYFSITFSSIFSISVSLFMVMLMVVSYASMSEFSTEIESEFMMQVSLSPTLQSEAVSSLSQSIENMEGVVSVAYSSKDEELQSLIDENGGMFTQYQGEGNPLYDVLIVQVEQASLSQSIAQKIEELEGVVGVDYGGSMVLALMNFFEAIKIFGAVLAALMMVLAVFLIRGSIKMTIAQRADEIAIMRQVGAYNWYILTPFILEGLVIGFFGGLIPSLILMAGYPLLYSMAHGVLVSSLLTLVEPFPFTLQVSAGLMLAGMAAGMCGSWLAARKYLKEAR